jgi:3-dehydroquinate dehydratase/shikimate dehydrogenase
MICISIAQESRRFALADMLNAAPQCDLLEVRLDRFGKAPEIGELLANKPRPVIMSCRRLEDGGEWDGSETERQALLRQCIISKADYVEIELDIADAIPPFPPTQRVITYTNLQETPRDLADIYAEAQRKKADVVKLITLARTPEQAWPLVQILGRPALPTVAVGLGRQGVMLTVLGKKIGAPWTYAALERGMEAYPGQPTVQDLEQVYHYRAIDASTRLIGVTGFGDTEFATVAGLNAALAYLDLPVRCLPLQVGSLNAFRKVIEAVKLASVVVDDAHRGQALSLATELEPAAVEAQSADVLLHRNDQWHGYNTFVRAVLMALENSIPSSTQTEKRLRGRHVMIVGNQPMARTIAYGVQRRGGEPIIASRDLASAWAMAQALGCRHIPFEAIYTTLHDVLIVTPDSTDPKGRTSGSEIRLHPGVLRPGIAVLDLTASPRLSDFLREAIERGCYPVTPRQVLLNLLEMQTRLITGKEVPQDCFTAALEVALGPEE